MLYLSCTFNRYTLSSKNGKMKYAITWGTKYRTILQRYSDHLFYIVEKQKLKKLYFTLKSIYDITNN